MKDVVEQQTRGRGGLIDQALVQRRRKEAMARLGESVYVLIQSGNAGELALDPEIGMVLSEIDALDDEEYNDDHGDYDDGNGFVPSPDSRSEAVSSANYRPPAPKANSEEFRVWRPVMPPDDEEVEEVNEATSVPEPLAAEPSSRIPRKSAQRKRGGGIQFVPDPARPGDLDSDEDLESYMHEDDV